jgi:hypothetical protein
MQSNRNNPMLKEEKAKRLSDALRQNLLRRKSQKQQESDDGQRQREEGFKDQTS